MIFNYCQKNNNILNSKNLNASSEKKYNNNRNIFSYKQKKFNDLKLIPNKNKTNFYSIKKDFNNFKSFIENRPLNNSSLNILKNLSTNNIYHNNINNYFSSNQLNIFDKIKEINNQLKSSSYYNKLTINPPIIKNKNKFKSNYNSLPLRAYSPKENSFIYHKNKNNYNNYKINFECNKKNKLNFIIPESKRIDNKLFNNINNFRKDNINFFRELSKN